MTPRLVLLTGPAAGEVANYLDDEETTARFEVRDYWDALARICVNDAETAVEYRIRSLPGGEAWLVGLVLTEPAQLETGDGWGPRGGVMESVHYHPESNLPDRLAILAPDPPALLVERVRAWGGEVWHCEQHGACRVLRTFDLTTIGEADTWPETVRAALGEGL